MSQLFGPEAGLDASLALTVLLLMFGAMIVCLAFVLTGAAR